MQKKTGRKYSSFNCGSSILQVKITIHFEICHPFLVSKFSITLITGRLPPGPRG